MSILFPRDLSRLQYLLRSLLLVLCGTICDVGVDYLGKHQYATAVWFTIYCAYGVVGLMLPRIPNAGYSPFYLFWLLVPFANLWVGCLLYFAPPSAKKEGTTSVLQTATRLRPIVSDLPRGGN